MKTISVLGIDLAKSVFHLVGMDEKGKVLVRRRASRARLMAEIEKVNPQIVAMEACSGANFFGQQLRSRYQVRVIAPQHVKPFVKTNKNDYNDAEAICEAALRPTMRFVSIKNRDQQDIQTVHRSRSHYVEMRTATVNMIRGFLAEFGIIMPKGIGHFRKQLSSILDSNEIPLNALQEIRKSFDLVKQLDVACEESQKVLELVAHNSEDCRRLIAIEGVGTLTATSIVSAVSDAKVFKNGRQFAAFLGLVPKQRSTGGRPTLLGISKRGDAYIRTLLISGARAALRVADRRSDRKSQWATALKQRRGHNKACVALANKNARIIWAMLAKGEDYRVAA